MKKILLISDTHSLIDEAIGRHAKNADELWHAGDIGSMGTYDELTRLCPVVRAVYGNIDDAQTRSVLPKELYFTLEGLSVLMTHTGGYPGKYEPHVKYFLESRRPDLFISGHSHILKVIMDKKLGTMHFNPGAAGIYGFHKTRTMLRFTIGAGKISDLELIEWSK